MPHVDITMYPGRDDKTKKDIAVKIQRFLAEELKMDEKYVSVTIEDVEREKWSEHIANMKKRKVFVEPFE